MGGCEDGSQEGRKEAPVGLVAWWLGARVALITRAGVAPGR